LSTGIVRRKKYAQPVSFSDGGDVYIYDKGITIRETREITWEHMLSEDLDKLLDFIDLVHGGRFVFTFTDEAAVAHEVIILNPNEIASAPVSYGIEGGITLELLFIGP
jgi:hypothetical protein